MVMHPYRPDGCLLVHGALASGPESDSIRKELSLRRAGAESAVCRRLEKAIAEGDLARDTDAAKLARYLITIVWGMSVQAAGGATRAQLREIAEQAMERWPPDARSRKAAGRSH